MTILASLLLLANTIVVTTEMPLGELQPTQKPPRNQQWVYRDTLGSGDKYPTAVFLSWDYSSVIFLAECSKNSVDNIESINGAGIRLYYFYNSDEDDIISSMILNRGIKHIESVAVKDSEVFYSDFSISTKLLEILKPNNVELEIDARNDMGEPWYVGQAEPLYQLAKTCDKNAVK